jgi:V-type H+-transporting ATPase subunit A
MYRIASMKFEDPSDGEAAILAKFEELERDLVSAFRALEDEFR